MAVCETFQNLCSHKVTRLVNLSSVPHSKVYWQTGCTLLK
jgi:hypothetical protein